MNIAKKVYFLLSFVLSFFCLTKTAFASEKFVTVVNPVRISSYTKNPSESISAQQKVVSSFNLPTTWLFTYDSFQNKELVETVSHFPRQDEFGIFLEVSEALANKALVPYKKPEHWYHPNTLFLSGYAQSDRIKIIDTVFNSFKQTFGYYPTSVGSWWTDSFSLSYMHDKYGVTANLMCSDQFSTDNYQLWGQYWGAPFYPTQLHAGIPADSQNKIDVVNIQWAYRDPLNGYSSSLFSTQDYFTTDKNLNIDYFKKLLNVYLHQPDNSFGQVVVGLESDFDPSAYTGEYTKQLEFVSQLRKNEEVQVVTMNDFSRWFRNTFTETPPMHFSSNDLLGSSQVVEWYENSRYRMGIRYVPGEQKISVFDWREYSPNFYEPYFVSPNRNNHLSIVIPSIIDRQMNANTEWELPIHREDMEFHENGISFSKAINIPLFIQHNNLLRFSNKDAHLEIETVNWPYKTEGIVLRALTPAGESIFSSTKAKILVLVLFVASILMMRIGYKRSLAILWLIVFIFLYTRFSTVYMVTPGELEGLQVLESLPDGIVLVPNSVCLQCEYHSSYKPIIFSNNRGYVSTLSRKRILYDTDVLNTSREDIKKAFQNTQAKYILLTQIENYHEMLPFSPGDIGVKKVFGNANVEIWERE